MEVRTLQTLIEETAKYENAVKALTDHHKEIERQMSNIEALGEMYNLKDLYEVDLVIIEKAETMSRNFFAHLLTNRDKSPNEMGLEGHIINVRSIFNEENKDDRKD